MGTREAIETIETTATTVSTETIYYPNTTSTSLKLTCTDHPLTTADKKYLILGIAQLYVLFFICIQNISTLRLY